MSSIQKDFSVSPASLSGIKNPKYTHFSLLLRIALIILLVEGVIMGFLSWMPRSISPSSLVIIDVMLLSLISTPLIYIMALRPYVGRWQKATAGLQASESHFKRLYQKAPLPYQSLNEDAEFLDVNNAWLEMLGYNKHEIIGKPITDFLKPESYELLETKFPRFKSLGEVHGSEFGLLHKDGTEISVSVDGQISYDDAGNIIQTHCILSNLTEIKRVEQILIDAIESISDGFALFDNDDRLVICNSRYKEIYAACADAIVPGATFEDILRFGVENDQFVLTIGQEEAFIRERVGKHQNPSGVVEQNLSGGRWIRIDERKTKDGGTVGIRTDITLQKNNEREIIKHRDNLEELVRDRTADARKKAVQLEKALLNEKEYNALQQKFISLVSHEFRTPLSIIDGAAQRLLRNRNKVTPDEIEDRVDKIRKAINRMINLMETTLYASRLDEGKIEMKVEPCNIGELLIDVCNRQAEISSRHQIRVEVDGLPDKIICDHRILDQAFSNLLSNAVKYSPQSPLISVKGWRDGDNACISVSDQGLGISEEDLPNIFKRFFRAKTAEGINGSGIGLSVTKEFIEMHKGTVEVSSKCGEGSIFTVRLPISGEEGLN